MAQVLQRKTGRIFMKPSRRSRTVGRALIFLVLAAAAPVALSQSSPVNPINLTVNPDDHTAYGSVIPNTSVRPETHTEKLCITLQNTTPQSYSNLTVRYCIFDKDVQSHKIAVARKHETTVSINPLGTLTITSAVASISYTPQHEIAIQHPSAKTREKLVKATGKAFAGYGVELLYTNQVIGQCFNPLERTNQFNAAFSGSR
jgi:hypothetical protein